jgi:hypothetical protein
MISAKDLSEEQVAQVSAWAEAGAQLPDIQKKLGEEFGLSATYMDTRFLVLDLGIEVRSEEPGEEAGGEPEAAGEEPSPIEAELAEPVGGAGGSVTVSTDEISRPGAMVSGSVTFSDGQKARWLIDQLGRPGLEPDTPGYQPAEEDLVAFEQELRKALQAL